MKVIHLMAEGKNIYEDLMPVHCRVVSIEKPQPVISNNKMQ
jgi:hypothetical protein